MLKPADSPPPPFSERPVGELVHQLIDEGKAYALAEVRVAKAVAMAKGRALALPVSLFAAALLFSLAGITAFAVGVVTALSALIGPFAAGFVGMLIFLTTAGLLGWYGAQRLKRVL
jgi:uncharacterized protein YaaW (UPF0174 family)